MLASWSVISPERVQAIAPTGPDFWCNGHRGCYGPSDTPPCYNPHFYRRCNAGNWGTNYHGGRVGGGSVGIRT